MTKLTILILTLLLPSTLLQAMQSQRAILSQRSSSVETTRNLAAIERMRKIKALARAESRIRAKKEYEELAEQSFQLKSIKNNYGKPVQVVLAALSTGKELQRFTISSGEKLIVNQRLFPARGYVGIELGEEINQQYTLKLKDSQFLLYKISTRGYCGRLYAVNETYSISISERGVPSMRSDY